jgi:osmotically inducible protein OsmC
MRPKEGGGHEIYKMRLVVRGWVQGIDEQTFRQIAEEADQSCPVSNLLRNGLEIEREVTLGTEDAGLGGGMTE